MITNVERANRFKQARTVYNVHGKQGLKAVYDATGVSQSMIADLETSIYKDGKPERPVQYQKVLKLAEHYGVNVAWLMGQSDSPSLDENSQTVTKMTGLTAESVQILQGMNHIGIIDCLNKLLNTEAFQRMITDFSTARTINMNSTQSDEVAQMIENLTRYGLNNGMDSTKNRVSDRQLIDIYLWKASHNIDNAFRQILEEEKSNGTC